MQTNTTETLNHASKSDDVAVLTNLIKDAEIAVSAAEAKLEAMTLDWPDFRTVNAFQLSIIVNNYYGDLKQLRIEKADYESVLDHLRNELRKAMAAVVKAEDGVRAAERENKLRDVTTAAMAEPDPLKRAFLLTKLAGAVAENRGGK